MTKLEIINETVRYYAVNPRGYDTKEEQCTYITSTGAMCAVGRCLSDPKWLQTFSDEIGVASISSVDKELGIVDKVLDDLFKDEYKGHELEFWDDLQSLHDSSASWDTSGSCNILTHYGEDRLNRLIEKWRNK